MTSWSGPRYQKRCCVGESASAHDMSQKDSQQIEANLGLPLMTCVVCVKLTRFVRVTEGVLFQLVEDWNKILLGVSRLLSYKHHLRNNNYVKINFYKHARHMCILACPDNCFTSSITYENRSRIPEFGVSGAGPLVVVK